MRLLRTQSDPVTSAYTFEEFEGETRPPYAILSHTWGQDEVLFCNVRDSSAPKMKGYAKMKSAADKAREEGFEYIWIDTCCIDKSSSAELSEAINSMYAWYQNAATCYAHLADVTMRSDGTIDWGEFERSRWFRRGWCLQELLAPSNVTFFDSSWLSIGSKQNLCDQISDITGIKPGILLKTIPLEEVNVGTRMSWAAHRETTRVEDIAYCLLGIFSVNMPMLYGEGKKAFQRLQEEIMKQSDDHSLFAWLDPEIPEDQLHGLLADSPKAFAVCDHEIKLAEWANRASHSMSNKGLQIQLCITPLEDGTYQATLDCPLPYTHDANGNFDHDGDDGFIVIYLQKVSILKQNNQYARIRCGELHWSQQRGSLETVVVSQTPSTTKLKTAHLSACLFWLLVPNVGPPGPAKWKEECWAILDMTDDHQPAGKTRGNVRWVRAEKSSLRQVQLFGGPKRLSAVILFCRQRRHGIQGIVVLLGTIDNHDFGFCALEWYPNFIAAGYPLGRMEAYEETFRKQAQGGNLPIPVYNSLVTANTDARFANGRTVYTTSIVISSDHAKG